MTPIINSYNPHTLLIEVLSLRSTKADLENHIIQDIYIVVINYPIN